MAMTTGSFDKTSLPWELQKTMRWLQEWLELQFAKTPTYRGDPIPGWLVQTIFWLVAVGLTTWLVWQGYRWWRMCFRDRRSRSQPYRVRTTARAREAVTVAQWLQQAQAFQRQGNYTQACRALYMAMLQRLDDSQQLPLSASRTDGEYWQAIQSLPRPQPYAVLLDIHEQLCFGNAAMSLETFQRCQQAYREIDSP
jgi:Domain of unknown function (DUF4129)